VRSKIIFILLVVLVCVLPSCKHQTCPTYKDQKFLSPKKYRKQIREYQNGKLGKKIKKAQRKEDGDNLKVSGKKQKKAVPK
jgi:Fe-S oxidoreductase